MYLPREVRREGEEGEDAPNPHIDHEYIEGSNATRPSLKDLVVSYSMGVGALQLWGGYNNF